MQPMDCVSIPSEDLRELKNEVNELSNTSQASNNDEVLTEKDRRRKQVIDALYERDVINKDKPMESSRGKRRYKLSDISTPFKRAVKLPEFITNIFPKKARMDTFLFPPSGPFDGKDSPSILDNQLNVLPECLALRQSFTTKYLKAVQRCLKENIYDYKVDPNFDPMFPEPDPDIPSLHEALLREKEEKSKIFKREIDRQAEKDRERMPPPPIPQTPSTSDESGASTPYPNGHTPNLGPNGTQIKDELGLPEKKYVCKVEGCVKAYKNLQGLKNHVKKEHPGVAIPNKLSHSEETILASALGSGTPARTSLPPVNQRLPPVPQAMQRPRTPQQMLPPLTNSQSPQMQPGTPVTQRYPDIPQHHPQQQQMVMPPQPQQYVQQQQQPLQYVTVTQTPQGYQQVPIQQPSQNLPLQQQQARLPAPPSQMQPTQVYHQQHLQESPQSVPSEYPSAAPSPISVMSQDSADETQSNGGQIRRTPSKAQVSIAAKLTCPYCMKRHYKTQQNLQKHIREMHPQAPAGEVEVTYSKPSQPQTYYVPTSTPGRQEMIYVEQNPGMQEAGSVTIVRQQSMQMAGEDQSQMSQGQIIQSPNGQQYVQYQVHQVPVRHQPQQQQASSQQPQPQLQQQPQPMEVDSTQQSSQTYATTTGSSQDVIMIDSTPPQTPGNVPIVSSGQPQQQQHQQVYIQTNGPQVIRTASGQQIIRPTQGRQVYYPSQQVHIIQQQSFTGNPGEKYTVVLKPGQQLRTINPQQISRNGQQVMTAQQGGNTYIYPQGSAPGNTVVTRYFTAPQRPVTSNAQTVATSIPSSTAQVMEAPPSDGADYYSAPPQLTPQQTIPVRAHRPPPGYPVYNRRASAQGQVRMQPSGGVVNQGQKTTSVQYVQVPQGSTGTYISTTRPGSIQYVRASNGTRVALQQSQQPRMAQQVQQQYSVAGQQGTYVSRPAQGYAIRSQPPRPRMALGTPQTARRPPRPASQQQHPQQVYQQQPQAESTNPNVQIQRMPAPSQSQGQASQLQQQAPPSQPSVSQQQAAGAAPPPTDSPSIQANPE